MNKIVMSASQITQAACGRRYELGYIEGLEKKPSTEYESRYFGTAFHAGVAAALDTVGSSRGKAITAVNAARAAIEEMRIPNKTDWQGLTDLEYHEMLERVDYEVTALLNWFIPTLGERYRVATPKDVFELSPDDTSPMIEWEFMYDLTEAITVKGIIDAVLIDNTTGEIILVDWKTRASILPDREALIDGQLHLYAAIVSELGGKIDTVRMWQVKKIPPKPVTLVDGNSRPSKAQNAGSTNKATYLATLPEAMHKDYGTEVFMATIPSIKPDSYFQAHSNAAITEVSNKLMIENLKAQARLLRYYRDLYEAGEDLPAQYSSYHCKSCPFMMLCSDPFRYGGDAAPFIEKYYNIKEGYKPDDVE